MSSKASSRYCPHCDRRVLAVKNTPNHLLHLILSIVTAGLWLFVWLAVAVFGLATSYRCNRCGTSV